MQDFRKTQYAFAAYLREPSSDNTTDKRKDVYRDLIYNTINNTVANAFPVLRQLYNEGNWQQLIHEFLHRHKCVSPFFREIPQEFLSFLQEEYQQQVYAPPFLLELAHYEWIEVFLATLNTEIDLEQVHCEANLLTSHPVLSPLMRVLEYQWPVHKLSPDYQPATPPETPTYIIVYRDAADATGFIEANAVTARLIQLLQQNKFMSGQSALDSISAEMPHIDKQHIQSGGAATLKSLRNKGIILGGRAL